MSDTKTNKTFLFDEFPPVSTEEWEAVIKRDLKGANYKEKLRWDTREGIKPLPFYRRDDLKSLDRTTPIPKKYTDGKPNSWEIRESIFEGNISLANETAQNALEHGADALQFHLHLHPGSENPGGDLEGQSIQSQEDFSRLVNGISLEDTALHFDADLASPALLAMLRNEVQQQNLHADKIWATFSYDPFTYLLENGHFPKNEGTLKKDIVQLGRFGHQHLPGARPLCIDARLYHNAGGSIVQELGFSLATASEYLSILTDNGFDADEVTDLLHFSFSVGSNYFLEIAKFRAVRLLWKNLLDAFGAEETGAYIHAETSQWNKTLYDPYTNMLRTSTEGMSAAIGGCDSLTILPFDGHFRMPNQFSKRIARNQQIILSEEAHLDKVKDPSAGSYYIEKLSNDMANEAWTLFQETETAGGILKAIKSGTMQSVIKRTQLQRDQAIASRGRIFVGTNQYSNAEDKMSDKINAQYQTVSLTESDDDYDVNPENLMEDLASTLQEGATLGDLVPHLFELHKQEYSTITSYRGSEAFEELRLATEKHSATPTVLTLPLGSKSWRKGRSAFTANFFGCAGYKIIDPIGFEDVDTAIKAVKEQQPDLAVICSSDKEYKELVPAICKRLGKLENRPIIVLAGYPKDDIEDYKKAGVDEFIYAKGNVLETLTRFQQKLDII